MWSALSQYTKEILKGICDEAAKLGRSFSAVTFLAAVSLNVVNTSLFFVFFGLLAKGE